MSKQPKALFLNVNAGVGSTGRLCVEQALRYMQDGWDVRLAYGREQYVDPAFQDYLYPIGSPLSIYSHVAATRLFDSHGFASKAATRKFLKWADSFRPDLLWLHNIHGYYIHVELLFAWIKSRPEMKVYWTLHDCWAFTGHCACFQAAQCDKWKTHCRHCGQKREYPKSLLSDCSEQNFSRKKAVFTGVKNMTLITPSNWLATQIGLSFLKDYPVQVQYNTIDTAVFRPTPNQFREDYALVGKKVLLCVANIWQKEKGLYDILLLHTLLDSRYAIVMVGLSPKQIHQLSSEKAIQKLLGKCCWPEKPEKYTEVARTEHGIVIPCSVWLLYEAITGQAYTCAPASSSKLLLLQRTQRKEDLAKLYSMADVFINPTHDDNYPTVNLEAQACRTWLVTYDTGGARETLK